MPFPLHSLHWLLSKRLLHQPRWNSDDFRVRAIFFYTLHGYKGAGLLHQR